jgi:poly(beta-D-mannuronate) lyase
VRKASLIAFAVVVLLSVIGNAKQPDRPLQSPWDLQPVTLTPAPYSCPAAPHLARDLDTHSYYTDSHHSIVDPKLKEEHVASVEPLDDYSKAVVKAADAYLTKGSRAAAECVVTLLEAAAKDKALTGNMETGQAVYTQGWDLGSWAVAYLKVRGSGVATPEQGKQIVDWLKKLARDNQDYYEKRAHRQQVNDAHNNHLYWAGFALAAAGMAANDRGLFQWGMDAYKEGVRDITPEGTLPREMDRAGRALHYHLYALGPLIMLAEFGEANGEDLYAEKNYAIKRLVARCVSGLQDPSYFVQKTGVTQDMPKEMAAWEIGWAVPYLRRFPDEKISALLDKAPSTRFTTWGGLPVP